MNVAALSVALIIFTLAMWGLFVWLFGEWGILGVIITGFTLPLWAGVLIEWAMERLGIDDE